MRDEAHRFAVAYHRKLRGKDLFLPERAVEESAGTGGGGRERGFETIAGALQLSPPCAAVFALVEKAKAAPCAAVPPFGPWLSRIIR